MLSVTSAASCTAIGKDALRALTTGSANIAIGRDCMQLHTTGEYNVAIGVESMEASTGTTYNTAVGFQSLKAASTSGDYNTAIGRGSLKAVSTGTFNVGVGQRSGEGCNIGTKNVFIGNYTGAALTDGDFSIYIGSDATASGGSVQDEVVIGYNATGKGSNTAFLAPQSATVYNSGNTTTWNQISDRRIKKNIADNNQGLEIINQIRVRNFEYRTLDEIVDFDNPKAAVVEKEGLQIGTIAQEIETVLPNVIKTESTGVKTVDNDNIIWYLVNAVKELSAEIEELKKK